MPLFAEKGEGKELPKKDASSEEFAKVILNSKNPSVVIGALGQFLENNKNLGDEIVADTLIKLSKKKAYFQKAVALASFFDVEPLIPNIKDSKDGLLASYILAAKAYQNLMYENIDMRAAPADPNMMEEKGKGKKRKKNAKNKKMGKKNVGAPSEIKLTIPEELFKIQKQNDTILSYPGSFLFYADSPTQIK